VNVEVKLFANLRKYMPGAGDKAEALIELDDSATIADVLSRLGIPAEAKLMLLVDGIHERDTARGLQNGCTLCIFPPLAGGSTAR